LLEHWIDAAAARRGEAPYLEEATGAGQLTFAGLQRATHAWARCLDRAGIPPGARVAIRLPEPLGYASATGKVARARLRELASAQPDVSTRGRAAPAGGTSCPTVSATTARATATAACRSGA
jgi:hypothetical protein